MPMIAANAMLILPEASPSGKREGTLRENPG